MGLFIVAEISSNHMGDYQNAANMIVAAKAAGADAVKFQLYKPAEIAADEVIVSGPWKGQNYRTLYARGMTPWGWFPHLFKLAKDIGITMFVSPFSEEGVVYLEKLDCPIYKIASPEINHVPLIKACAATGKPLIISTGMATLAEIHMAEATARQAGAKDITFLHCISAYPAFPADFNLATLLRLHHFCFNVGLSDHSRDSTAAIAAVAMGACVIEKHFTLSHDNKGPDAAFSLDPDEFAAMVKACRDAYSAVGEVTFGPRRSEAESFQYRRSLWLKNDIKANEVVKAEDIAILRPNYGADPKCFDIFVGMKAARDLKAGTPLRRDCLK